MRAARAEYGVVAIAGAVLCLCAACAGVSDKWWGSVDAAFKYRPDDHSTVVHEVSPASRAGRAGLASGDLVVAVDGQDLTRATLEGVLEAMRGPVGSVAVLTVKRGNELREITVERTVRSSESQNE